jgi:hypothetical protein
MRMYVQACKRFYPYQTIQFAMIAEIPMHAPAKPREQWRLIAASLWRRLRNSLYASAGTGASSS